MHKEFHVGDHVYHCVRPRKSSLKLESCTNLILIYCGPFEQLDRIRVVVYRLEFPTNNKYHNIFHVYLPKKYVHDPNNVIDWDVI